MVAGMPRLRTVSIEGPYNVKGVSEHAEPRAALRVSSGIDAPKRPVRREDSLESRASRIPAACDAGRRRGAAAFYKQARQNGGNFDDGHSRRRRAGSFEPVRSCTASRTIRPDARPGAAHPVSDLELASRLSFFLWSSIPDEKLLDLAAAGRLAGAREC